MDRDTEGRGRKLGNGLERDDGSWETHINASATRGTTSLVNRGHGPFDADSLLSAGVYTKTTAGALVLVDVDHGDHFLQLDANYSYM